MNLLSLNFVLAKNDKKLIQKSVFMSESISRNLIIILSLHEEIISYCSLEVSRTIMDLQAKSARPFLLN